MNYEELQNHDKSTTPIHADEVRRTYTSEQLQEVIANAEQHDPALVERCEQVENRYKASVLQTVVATVLCAALLIPFASYYFMPDEFTRDYIRTIYNIIPNTLLIIGFILLAYKANNKANRIALSILIFLQTVFLFNLIDESLDAASYYTVQSCWVLIALLQIYSYWLIIENNRLSEKHRVWINLISVFIKKSKK
ncbi:MAG: hypothetical protein J6W69_08080, partial [Bacteroidales bacterium]|nr:hypothetical protein [Bacteroidales bacterium]